MKEDNLTIELKQRAFLMDFHLPVQKAALWFVAPISVAVFTIGAILEPSWQNWVRLAAISGMAISWAVGYWYSRHKDLEVSVKIAIISILVFQSVELLMVTGTEAATLIGLLATTCYAALFSKRYLLITGVTVFIAVVVSELVKWSAVYPVIELTGGVRLFNQLLFTTLLYSLAIFILRKGQSINDALFSTILNNNAAQLNIIQTANKTQSTVDDVTSDFKQVSVNFVSQTSEHAATTAEVKITMEHVKKIAQNTAQLASRTHKSGQKTKISSLAARQQLLKVEGGFEELSKTVIEARETMNTLASHAANISDVLAYNKTIGDRIKILAVNAGIEAAKAGRHGVGFRVIAQELRSMIGSTEKNLQKSREILWTINSQANNGSRLISKSDKLFGEYSKELRLTGEIIGKIVDSFVNTSEDVSLISDGALKQSVSIGELNNALEQLNLAALQLEGSGTMLIKGLDKISNIQKELRDVLGNNSSSKV